MSIVLVDNNTSSLSELTNEVNILHPERQIQSFTDPLLSAKYICNNEVSLAFLSVTMRPVDGFMLLKVLKANKPLLPIIMLLDNEAQREITLCEAADGWLVKPVSAQRLETAIQQMLPQ